METKKMRPLEEIMKELTDVANDIQEKRRKLDELNTAQSRASNDVSNAQNKAVSLRNEMEEFLNLLVPASQHSRVRLSA